MSTTQPVEREVKFRVRNLDAVARRLAALGARQTQPRVHEYNLRFDTPDGRLTRSRQVLRLRRDRRATLTYKGPGDPQASVAVRREIEVEVSDFDATWQLLEALGYRVALIYEKYRAAYTWQHCVITLDDTPMGAFVEIEGPSAAAIRQAAQALGLRWEHRLRDSYAALFQRLRARLVPPPRHLTFDALAAHQPLPANWLPVPYADEPPAA